MSIVALFAAIAISTGSMENLDTATYNNWSGVTYVGDDAEGYGLFMMTRDSAGVGNAFGCPCGAKDGLSLQAMRVKFNQAGEVTERQILPAFKAEGVGDAEDLAYDRSNDSLWIADENSSSIVEYKFTSAAKTGVYATMRAVSLPEWYVESLRNHIGIQSVAISSDSLTLWTANDDALACDGLSSLDLGADSGPVVRLVKFTRRTVNEGWSLSAMYAYQCDPCAAKGISAMGFSYDVCHSGVASLAVLPDGRVLVLERNADTTSCGRARAYVPDFSSATDIKDFRTLSGASYSAVKKGSSLREWTGGSRSNPTLGICKDYVLVDYEGICLGPQLDNGDIPLVLVRNGGLVFKYTLDLKIFTVDFKINSYSGLGVNRLTGFERVVASDEVVDTFEEYAEGVSAESIVGWSGEATVVASRSTIGVPPGYPVAKAAHAQSLAFDASVQREYGAIEGDCTVDMLVQVMLGDVDEEGVDDDIRIAISFDANGCAVIWHADGSGQLTGTTLEDFTFANGEWVRLSLVFDYGGRQLGYASAQVRLNGSPCYSAANGSSWYRLLGDGDDRLKSMAFIGEGMVDELLVRKLDAAKGPDFAIASADDKAPAVGGVPVSWFNDMGLPWRPSMKAPGANSLTLAAAYATGLDPFGSKNFEIIDFSLVPGIGLEVIFNGARTDASTAYRVEGANEPTFAAPIDVTSQGAFKVDKAKSETTWSISPLPSAKFYRVHAVPK